MKIIIYWLTLMAILPVVYFRYWKKQWRIILGFIIAIFLLIGYFLPGKMCFSLLKEEEKREKENGHNFALA